MKIYNMLSNAPQCPQGFKATGKQRKYPIDNIGLEQDLKKEEDVEWEKVIQEGTLSDGRKVSIHYCLSARGKVADVEVHY